MAPTPMSRSTRYLPQYVPPTRRAARISRSEGESAIVDVRRERVSRKPTRQALIAAIATADRLSPQEAPCIVVAGGPNAGSRLVVGRVIPARAFVIAGGFPRGLGDLAAPRS